MSEQCSVAVCDRPATVRGWCKGHYQRWLKKGDPGVTAIGIWSMPDAHPLRKSMRNRWFSMIHRCESPRSNGYHKYGARGITVCERWHDFDLYLADVGYPPGPGMSLDRIDNDGPYEPGNVRWATAREQRLNQRPRRSYWPNPAKCGTNGGYQRHLGYGEETCPECRAAHALYVRTRAAQRKAGL